MKKTCYCSQELCVCVTLEYLKGIQWDSDQLLNICSPFRGLGQCNKLAIDSLNKSSTYSSILLPGMAAANFKAWCTTVILEAAFLNNKKKASGLGQVHPNTHQAQTFKRTQWVPATAFYCLCDKQNKFRNFFSQASMDDLFLMIFPVASPPNFSGNV